MDITICSTHLIQGNGCFYESKRRIYVRSGLANRTDGPTTPRSVTGLRGVQMIIFLVTLNKTPFPMRKEVFFHVRYSEFFENA
jgi:hypothetical protein